MEQPGDRDANDSIRPPRAPTRATLRWCYAGHRGRSDSGEDHRCNGWAWPRVAPLPSAPLPPPPAPHNTPPDRPTHPGGGSRRAAPLAAGGSLRCPTMRITEVARAAIATDHHGKRTGVMTDYVQCRGNRGAGG